MNGRTTSKLRHVPPREFRSKAEVQAAQMREGLIAFEHRYDLQNVLALSKESQRVYWQLRNLEAK